MLASNVESICTGTVAPVIRLTRTTLLLTDLIGSSALLRELGDEVGGAVIHRLLGRQMTLMGHLRGSIIKTLGDGILARFSSPAAAVQAAALIAEAHQRDLSGCSLLPVQVRIAVHHGAMGELPDGDLVGREATSLFELIGHSQPNRAILSSPVAQACQRFISATALPTCLLQKSGLAVDPWILESVESDPATQLGRIADLWSRLNPGNPLPRWTVHPARRE